MWGFRGFDEWGPGEGVLEEEGLGVVEAGWGDMGFLRRFSG